MQVKIYVNVIEKPKNNKPNCNQTALQQVWMVAAHKKLKKDDVASSVS